MKKIKEYISFPALIFLILAVFCAVIHIISVLSISFSEKFNLSVGAFFRELFSKITDFLPFSLGEIFVISSPLIVIALAVRTVILIKADGKKKIRFLCSFLAFISFFYSSFVLTFATAYRGRELDEKLGLERTDVNAEELSETLDIIIDALVGFEGKTEYDESGLSVMPFDFNTLGDKLCDVYSGFSKENAFISEMNSSPKAIMLSEPMTYTHISGVYTFFTGEANVNVNYPDFIIPYTMAHEMAHQRGIAREDEANFIAFIICTESDDDYIRYSGYLNMFEYLSNALYKADYDLYKEKIAETPDEVLSELIAYSSFFDKYRDSTASKVSDKVNDGYLISQGQKEGTKSYGLVVDLCVAYYREK